MPIPLAVAFFLLPPAADLAPLTSGVGDFDRGLKIVGLMFAALSSSEELSGGASIISLAGTLALPFKGAFLDGAARP